MPADPAEFGAEPNPSEVAVEDVAAARKNFLQTAEPPTAARGEEVINEILPEPTAAETAAALDELSKPLPLEGGPAPVVTPAAPVTSPSGTTVFASEEDAINAKNVVESLRTEQGVRTMVGQGLLALGYTPEQIEQLRQLKESGTPLVATPQAPAAPVPDALAALAGIGDDDVIEGKQLKDLLTAVIAQTQASAQTAAQAAAQQQVAPVAQSFEEQQARLQAQEAQQVANATYVQVLGPEPEDPASKPAYYAMARAVQAHAQQLLGEYPATPDNLRAVITRGHAAYVAEQEAAFQAYIGVKRAQAANQPANIGGGGVPTDGPVAEPKSLKEARAMAKDFLGAGA